jgi:hypothetical protein
LRNQSHCSGITAVEVGMRVSIDLFLGGHELRLRDALHQWLPFLEIV